MKKYLICCALIVAIYFGVDYFYYFSGALYIPHLNAQVSGTLPEDFQIRGVNVGTGKPGYYSTENAIELEEYENWLRQIQELGANTIRLNTLASPAFYEALYYHNEKQENPLYLIQGIMPDEYLNNSTHSVLDELLIEDYREKCMDTVNAVHGRYKVYRDERLLPTGYRYDVSKWIYGFQLGSEWNDNLVIYTNECVPQLEQYVGKFICTQDANNMEIFLAMITDEIIDYESRKYGVVNNLIVGNSLRTSPLQIEESVRRAVNTFGSIEAEHIKQTEEYKGQLCVAYSAFPFFPKYVAFEDSNVDNGYRELLTRLVVHHTMPVIVSEFGVSTSRGMIAYERPNVCKRDQGKLTEKEQGQALISLYQDIIEAGCIGGIAYNWQDEWHKRSWNTLPSVETDSYPYWCDCQSGEQSFGLLSFEPGRESCICYVDGNKEDWEKVPVAWSLDGYEISAQYDYKYIYLLIEKAEIDTMGETVFIPVDITPKSGSKYAKNLSLRMSMPADFVIQIDGETNSRVWVQERYDMTTAIFGSQMKRFFNQYVEQPKSNSEWFCRINMVLNERDYYLDGRPVDVKQFDFDDIQGDYYSLIKSFETGELTYGNANPLAEDYNSLSDYCFGDGFVEIRIPWQLFNFADPTTMRVHDDYYECYGVEYISIHGIGIGAGNGSKEIVMGWIPLEKLDRNPQYHERLKQSYYILQDYWTGLDKQKKGDKTL